MRLYDALDLANLLRCVPVIVRQLDLRLKPKLRLSVAGPHMYMHPSLLERKEEKTIPVLCEKRGGRGAPDLSGRQGLI